MKKVELLAPAGGYETMVGAFNAGADAVYLGGSKFGARAYADNFDTQQVLDAISYAHLHGKRIYLTVNTLVKEREYSELYDFLLPYAEKNLDGAIVQDLGVMRLIRDEFPNIELHASTQATVTGVYGARLLKSLGCVRVVPARELSLSEMKAIREDADVEVEAFIHGAMCYCYSGMCLFSSMVGTRSGNRGRCAQPCRLPYSSLVSKSHKQQYPLSLKDMCTVDLIPKLIEAGLDSFKIEGRMKKPEYAAGVTSVYRKYIDLYYKEPDKEHPVSKEDMEILKSLYLRTEVSEGYYQRHNGKEMVTLDSPAYNGTDERVLSKVRDKYLQKEMKIRCRLYCSLKIGSPLSMKMTAFKDGREITKEVFGNPVQAASKRPMDEEGVLRQLGRLGNTSFEAEEISVDIDDNGTGSGVFTAVSELNDLRRSLCEEMLKELTIDDSSFTKKELTVSGKALEKPRPGFHVLVSTKKQLDAVTEAINEGTLIDRIYVDSHLVLSNEIKEPYDIKTTVYAALPFMTRKEAFDGTADIEKLLGYKGLLVRNLEQLGYLKEKKYSGEIVLDYGVYIWNHQAAAMLSDVCSELSIPLELTIHEAGEVSDKVRFKIGKKTALNVYGYAPMMISAGCVKKTLDKCSGMMNTHHKEELSIVDRMGNNLNVTTNCRNCYNVIWNSYPTSLHKKMDKINSMRCFDYYRLDFTLEDKTLTKDIINYYTNSEKGTFPIADGKFTTGHYKRGVE